MKSLSSVLTSDLFSIAKSTTNIDVLIIGSGKAGVTSAIELANKGLSVVILEAGPFVLSSHVGSTPFRSRSDLTPQVHNLVRYRTAWTDRAHFDEAVAPPLNNDAWAAVGGRTLFWGGCTPRFAEWDFADWPFSYGEFEPYYQKAENLMHVSGPNTDRPAFFRGEAQQGLLNRLNEAGIEAVHASTGVDTQETLNGYMPRGFDSSSDRLIRSGLLAREVARGRIVLVPNTIAEHVDHDGRNVTGLVARGTDEEQRFRLVARHYTLAGGAIQSTRLALASGLKDLHPDVGTHIADHQFIQGLFKLRKPLKEPIYAFIPPTKERPYHIQIQGPFAETWYTPYHATVWLDCNPDGLYLLAYCFGVGESSETNEVVLTRGQSDGPGDLGKYAVIADRSDSDKRILGEMDAFLPQVADALDAELMRTQVNPLGAALHEIGGLRMSGEPDQGVTNSHGQFWRLPNLSVADAAAWPSQGSANSYLTITAWSLRHAEGVYARLSA
ncbi:GMC oxidoreductase [Roseibium sediminicola]|uniref:GMC family oxidoreductase n=1 Tax=Roseibium sediminicola TaxID=2933272 RepID=A0ABT0GQS8_9HYPH|nr:GMC family oxidoreductase [Roseibium sp. CAU 1639]MCK7611795.1 GMC family oxidoreductase [Roseibium sp. CAU 1639]